MVPEVFIDFDPRYSHNRKGKFLIISGPSGAGKNTLLTRVLPELHGVYYVPSATTRDMRPGESQLNPYVFLAVDDFELLIKKEKFLEFKKIHTGSYYGTHRPTIEYAIEHGYDIITDMDVLGCKDAVMAFPEDTFTIFITAPSVDELSTRLIGRDGDDHDAIQKRLSRVQFEMEHMPGYNTVLVNDHLEESSLRLKEIILQVISD
jgi:guanylate kinase